MYDEKSNILQDHTKAVGDKAAGYIWFTRISKIHINLEEYNKRIDQISRGVSVVSSKECDIKDTQDALNDALKNNDTANAELLVRTLSKEIDELLFLRRMDATARDAIEVLKNDFRAAIKSLHIRELSPKHAFKTATKGLEIKNEDANVNYLIRPVSNKGDHQERRVVRETKDPNGEGLRHSHVAKILYDEHRDFHGRSISVLTPVVLENDDYVHKICLNIQKEFELECSGAGSVRFSTALKHLTDALQSIPLTNSGGVYFCTISKAPVISFIRELVRWVDFKYRSTEGNGCHFLAVPLLGGEESEESIVHASNSHLQNKVASAIAQIQELRKERKGIPLDISEEDREKKERILKDRERDIREEVCQIQESVTVCLEGMGQTQGVLQQGSKILLQEYMSLLGIS